MQPEPDSDARLLRWWAERRDRVLPAVIAVMAVAAAVWLAYEFWRLLFQPPPMGAIDLRHRHTALHGWFARELVYTRPSVLDPPATHVLLWPLLGWNDLAAARWVWALTSAAALAWTSALTVRYTRAASGPEQAMAALLPLSAYAFGATIGNGQLGVLLLPLLIAGCVRLRATQHTWRQDLLTAALLLGALVKPNLSVPFAWIVLFVSRSLRPPLIAAAAYAVLTAIGAAFQPADPATLLRQTLANASAIGARAVPGNVANLHVWLGLFGLEALAFPIWALAIGALGAWVYRHRQADVWLLLGVTAYATLLVTYHRWYDDVLLLLPTIALFRIARTSEDTTSSAAAGVLLALTIASTLAPGGLFLFPAPLNVIYVAAQVLIWVAGLGFLAVQASTAREGAVTRARPAAQA